MEDPHSGDVDDDSYSCSGLCLSFLDVLSSDVRKETSELVHELCRTGVGDESAKERCTNVIIKIERELGQDHFICELVIKVLTELLRKICMLDCAEELINEHMERKKSEDIGCLLLLCRIYSLFGDYRKSIEPLKKAHQLAQESGEPLLLSLVLSKEACNVWHLKDPEEAKRIITLCEETLDNSDAAEMYNTFPFTEKTHRLMDVFKTLGYMHRLFPDPEKSLQYNLRALEILEKDEKSVTQMLKLESTVARSYSILKSNLTRKHCMNVFERAKTVSTNETFMIHHPLPILHSLQRVAFTMEFTIYQNESLEIREYLYEIAEKYLDENHPEVARLAADAAYLCNRMHNTEKETFYVERAKAALECGSIDLSHIKLHVRELSDAWYYLGMLFSNKNDFAESERCFKESVTVSIRVYGCSHPRLCRLYNSMGYLYKKNSKFPAALDSFRKCLEINEAFNSDNTKIIQRLKDEITKVKVLQRKKFSFTKTGE